MLKAIEICGSTLTFSNTSTAVHLLPSQQSNKTFLIWPIQSKHIDHLAYLRLYSYPASERKKSPNLVSNSVLLQPHWALVLMGYTVTLCLCTCFSLYLEHSFTRFMFLVPVLHSQLSSNVIFLEESSQTSTFLLSFSKSFPYSINL